MCHVDGISPKSRSAMPPLCISNCLWSQGFFQWLQNLSCLFDLSTRGQTSKRVEVATKNREEPNPSKIPPSPKITAIQIMVYKLKPGRLRSKEPHNDNYKLEQMEDLLKRSNLSPTNRLARHTRGGAKRPSRVPHLFDLSIWWSATRKAPH